MDKPYSGCRVYGPYKRRQDGRSHVIVIHPDGRRQTVSYPRYKLEIKLGKYLPADVDVHHLDHDVQNNEDDNLMIKSSARHKAEHATVYPAEEQLNCVQCGTPVPLNRKQLGHLTRNKKRLKYGPMCSRRCVGLYGKAVQLSSVAGMPHLNALKFGGTSANGNAEPSRDAEGVETRQGPSRPDEGIVQTTNSESDVV